MDEDGAHPAAGALTLEVRNVPPALTLVGAAEVDEGSEYALRLSSFDSGQDTITPWTIHWGDGTVETLSGNPTSATHLYADGPANVTITATATDEDGTFAAGNSVASVSLPATLLNG